MDATPRRTPRIYGSVVGPVQRQRIIERDNFTCQECGKTFPTTGVRRDYVDRHGKKRICMLEVDHIIPRRHGGKNTDCNLQALCTQCNCRKGAKV